MDNSTLDTVATAVAAGKCPIGLVGYNGTDVLHAMVLSTVENGNYVFKNSYGCDQSEPLKREFVRIPVTGQPWSRNSTETHRIDAVFIHYPERYILSMRPFLGPTGFL